MPDAPSERGDEPREGDERGCPEDCPLRSGRTARDANQLEVAPGRDRPRRSSVSPLSATNRPGSTSARRWRTSESVSGSLAAEVGDAGVDDEPVRRSTRVEVPPHRPSVGAGVGRPAGGLISRRDHGGVGHEIRQPGRGLEQHVRIVGPRPRRQRKQPSAIHPGSPTRSVRIDSASSFWSLWSSEFVRTATPTPNWGAHHRSERNPNPPPPCSKRSGALGPLVPAGPTMPSAYPAGAPTRGGGTVCISWSHFESSTTRPSIEPPFNSKRRKRARSAALL